MRGLSEIGFHDASIESYTRSGDTCALRVGLYAETVIVKFNGVVAVLDRGTSQREDEDGQGFLVHGFRETPVTADQVRRAVGLDPWRDVPDAHRNPSGLRRYEFLDPSDEEPYLVIFATGGCVE